MKPEYFQDLQIGDIFRMKRKVFGRYLVLMKIEPQESILNSVCLLNGEGKGQLFYFINKEEIEKLDGNLILENRLQL